MRVGARKGILIAVALLMVVLAVAPVSEAQPGQWRAINDSFSNLNDVWMISASSGWAVGDAGTILYYDGARWRTILSPIATNLESVSCFSSTNCWAVGPGPGMIHWDGTAWVDVTVLAGFPAGVGALHSIWIRSDGLGYAVGASGGTCNVVRLVVNPLPYTIACDSNLGAGVDVFRSVHLLAPGSGPAFGFIVGDAGVAYSLDALGPPGTWTSRACTANRLNAVHIISGTSAFAVGVTDTRVTWSGGPTCTVDGGAVAVGEDWRGMSLISASEGWIVGTAGATTSTLARRIVGGYTLLTTNVPTTVDLNGVYMLSASDGFAVGNGGTIIRWNGSQWNAVSSPTAAPNDLLGVWLASTGDGWSVGEAGIINRWTGAGWNFYQTSPVAVALRAIHGSSSSQIWAVGDDPDGAGAVPPAAIRWTGASWTDVSPTGVANNVALRGVFTVSSSLAFAVGDTGTLIKWDGTIWASIPPGTANTLRGVWFASSTEGWLVGDTGVVSHCTGAGPICATETSGVTEQLNAAHALSTTNVWAVGNDGRIIHRDATGWSIVPSGLAAGQHLNALHMVSATEGWAVGVDDAVDADGSPLLLFWDGFTWSKVLPVPSPPRAGNANDDLFDVWMVASQDGWSVGEDGLILRFGPIPSATIVTVVVTITIPTTVFATSTSYIATTTVSTDTSTTNIITSTSIVPTTETQTVATVQVTETETVKTTTTQTATAAAPPIPGFPIESILAGLVAGVAALFVVHRGRGSRAK